MKKTISQLLLFNMMLTLTAFINCNTTVSKWIVITTINFPTETIHKIAAMPDWHVVIVADKKTPSNWSHPGCDFLSIEQQMNLGYRITQFLPWNHYSRKNIGYLYAIEHGATIIYDTDDDNIILADDIRYLPQQATTLHIQTAENLANPYAYFGQPTLWPRGYPLEQILTHTLKPLLLKSTKPLIQQGLVNEDPDVDAIFRLTQGLLLDFTDHDPISLSKGVMSPFNTQNTIFHYEAFWGLLIPVATSFRVCDIWRGYVTQRLLWDIDGELCFLPATAVQKRNPHNLLNDFIQELDLYTKAGKLVNFLLSWKSTNPSFFNRIQELTHAMVQQEFYKEQEQLLTEAWLQDLLDVGYTPPLMTAA